MAMSNVVLGGKLGDLVIWFPVKICIAHCSQTVIYRVSQIKNPTTKIMMSV